MAALDIGFGLLARLSFRDGCLVAGTLVSLLALRGAIAHDSIWANDSWLSIAGREATSDALESLPISVPTRTLVEIENVSLDVRIETCNPRPPENDDTFPDPVREDWGKLAITGERSDGGVVDLEALPPRDWVEQQGITAGSLLTLNVEELEVDGLAFVHSVEPCLEMASGPGNFFTGRFVTRQVARPMAPSRCLIANPFIPTGLSTAKIGCRCSANCARVGNVFLGLTSPG